MIFHVCHPRIIHHLPFRLLLISHFWFQKLIFFPSTCLPSAHHSHPILPGSCNCGVTIDWPAYMGLPSPYLNAWSAALCCLLIPLLLYCALSGDMRRRDTAFRRQSKRRFPVELWWILLGIAALVFILVFSRERQYRSETFKSQVCLFSLLNSLIIFISLPDRRRTRCRLLDISISSHRSQLQLGCRNEFILEIYQLFYSWDIIVFHDFSLAMF